MATVDVPVPVGTLSVSIASSSMWLSDSLPIEVRDAWNRKVSEGRGSMRIDVPEGLYAVRATMPGGHSVDEIVEIRAGEPCSLRFGVPIDPDAGFAHNTSEIERSARAYLDTSPGDSPFVEVHLEEVSGAEVDHFDGIWLFQAQDGLTDAPHAVFTVGAETVTTSLLVNPASPFPLNACVVTAVDSHGSNRIVTRFARQRQVASTIDGLTRSGGLGSAASVLDAAAELLYDKYSDPTAAALGGLTLHRLGRLSERAAWVENLARDFPWLADGRILLVALHSHDDDAHDRAHWLQSLLEIARLRPMFADGHALLLDLLRRWPDESGAEQRAAALADVTHRIGGVDWSATSLTEYRV